MSLGGKILQRIGFIKFEGKWISLLSAIKLSQKLVIMDRDEDVVRVARLWEAIATSKWNRWNRD